MRGVEITTNGFPSQNFNPKTQVQNPNLGHPPETPRRTNDQTHVAQVIAAPANN
jgi:hypothetical protein